jgi:hypothetical protein
VGGYAIAFYAGLLGVCYVVYWLWRPIGIGQRRALSQTLLLANGLAADLLLGGVLLGLRMHPWSNDPREIATVLVVGWFAMTAVLWWFVPGKQHLWILLGVVGSSVGLWGWFSPLFIGSPTSSFTPAILYWLAAGTILPLAAALLGLLPPGCFRHQTE